MKEARTRGCTAPRAGIEPATLPADRRLSGYSAPQQGGQARPPPHAKLFCVRRVRNTDAAGASCSFGFFGDFRPFLGELEPPNLAGFVLGRLCPSPTPLCGPTAGRWMALGHCLCVSAREASSPAVLAKGKCLAYVAPAASTGAFLFASSGSRYRPMPRTGPRRCQRARSFCLCALLPQAADRVVAAGARGLVSQNRTPLPPPLSSMNSMPAPFETLGAAAASKWSTWMVSWRPPASFR
jgi:hypothetical protein